MKIKLCGFREENSLQAAIAENCNFIGFIFHENSPRFIAIDEAAKISKIIPQNIAKVAVVVDASLDSLAEIAQKFSPEFFQFHGAESVKFLSEVKKKFPQIKIIKAFKISEKSDLENVTNFNEVADIFLFDGKNAGSGKKFDWEILKDFSSSKEWFLSGGLNIDNVAESLRSTKAKMLDVSSGIEKVRGQKSSELIAKFMNKARDCA